MEKEKGSKPKNTKLLTILISVLAGAGVILITLSLLFGFGILGNKKITQSSGESEAEEAAEDNNESLDIASMTVDEAYEAYNSGGDYIFLDVRSEDEYKSGHIIGAVFIPLVELEGKLTELPEDKPIIA